MANRTVFLFPDTNIFIQCRALNTLDWSWLGDVDEIVLVVARPIQKEIDGQKQQRKGRVSERARRAHGDLRKLIIEGSEKILREAAPRVRLAVDLMLKPTPDLDLLDYDEPDHLLVACAHAYEIQHPGADVRILAHDGGPLGTAKALNMKIAAVPDDWLLEPEASDTDKKLAAAEAELKRLQKTEPEITLRCFNEANDVIEKVTIAHETFAPLTDAQLKALKAKLEAAFPVRTNFGSTEVETRPVTGIRKNYFSHETWEPAKQEDIDAYRTEHYPGWLSKCEYLLRHLHHHLEGERRIPTITFEGENKGTRPATSVFISIEAQGAILVRPPPQEVDDENDAEADGKAEGEVQTEKRIALPRPPGAPHGKWVGVRASNSPVPTGAPGIVNARDLLLKQLDPLGLLRPSLATVTPLTPPMHSFLPPRPDPHDPNAFYYKGGRRPSDPVRRYEFDCDQWRHLTGRMTFDVELHLDEEGTSDRGIVEMTVHAENLSDPVIRRIPVSFKVSAADLSAFADQLIEDLRSPFDALGI